MKTFLNNATQELEMQDIPDISLPQSEALIKQALFARIQKKRFSGLREFVSMLLQSKTLIGFVSGAAFTLLLVGGAYSNRNSTAFADYNPFATDGAKAKAAVRVGFKQAVKLSPEQVAQVNEKIQADMKASLEEALNAKDAHVLGKDEGTHIGATSAFGFARTSGNGKDALFINGKPAAGAAGHVTAVMHDGEGEVEKRIQYTDSKGNKVVLGLDANGIPVFKAVELSAAEQAKIDEQIKNGTPPMPFGEGEMFNIHVDPTNGPALNSGETDSE